MLRRDWMPLICGLLLLSALAGFGGGAEGAEGDRVFVQVERAIVRAAPASDSAVITQLNRGQGMVEVERRGDWVHARYGPGAKEAGWIHQSLVGAQQPAQSSSALGAAGDRALLMTLQRQEQMLDQALRELIRLREDMRLLRAEVQFLRTQNR